MVLETVKGSGKVMALELTSVMALEKVLGLVWDLVSAFALEKVLVTALETR
jgi:hypothetical protein